MTGHEYERRITKILREMSRRTDASYDWRRVSANPNHKGTVYFGVDQNGSIVINGEVLSLYHVDDIESIEYTWNNQVNEPDDLLFKTNNSIIRFNLLSEMLSFTYRGRDTFYVNPYIPLESASEVMQSFSYLKIRSDEANEN